LDYQNQIVPAFRASIIMREINATVDEIIGATRRYSQFPNVGEATQANNAHGGSGFSFLLPERSFFSS